MLSKIFILLVLIIQFYSHYDPLNLRLSERNK